MYTLPKKNVLSFLMKKVCFFFRSIFLKFCMQVPEAFIITYIKSEKSRRLLRGHQPPRREAAEIGTRAHLHDFVLEKEERKLWSCFLVYYTIVRAVVAPTRVARMPISQGCHPPRFFYFIYAIMNVKGTCMQIFKKIDRKNNHTFFIWTLKTFFLWQTVRTGFGKCYQHINLS